MITAEWVEEAELYDRARQLEAGAMAELERTGPHISPTHALSAIAWRMLGEAWNYTIRAKPGSMGVELCITSYRGPGAKVRVTPAPVVTETLSLELLALEGWGEWA